MKRFFTSSAFLTKRTVNRTLSALLCFAFFSAVCVGQNASAAQELGDLSGMAWKTIPDLNATFASEQSRMDDLLSIPDLPQADRSLYLTYKRLLTYLEADVQAGTPVDQSLVKNFDKVVAAAPNDADLKHLPENGLITLLPGLLEALTGVQALIPGQ